jgi:septal ring factor EnvC (AmiA/AmiB activator)
MSIFAKKQDWDQKDQKDHKDHKVTADVGAPPATGAASAAARKDYGIAEAIQLLRGLPVDQNPELVVRVVRATLASLNVRLADIIEDATRKQKGTQERIASEHSKVADLEKQLADHRKEIGSLEADLKETTTVKDRLQMAEKVADKGVSPPTPLRASTIGSAPHTATLLGAKAPEESPNSKD